MEELLQELDINLLIIGKIHNRDDSYKNSKRYQLHFRYGREEMLALFDKNVKPPASLTNFKSLYSEVTLSPLALIPATDEDVSSVNLIINTNHI